MKTLEADSVIKIPVSVRAELLGIDEANLAGLPEGVADACIDLVVYATQAAVEQYLEEPAELLSTVEGKLHGHIAGASLTDTDDRNRIIAELNRAIAYETADPKKVANLEHKVGRKIDNWLTLAQGNFTNHLTNAQAASRTGRTLPKEEVAKIFDVIGISSDAIAEKLGVKLSEPPAPPSSLLPSEEVAPTPPTFSFGKDTSTIPEALRPRFTIDVVRSSQRIGGAAAVGALVFTLAAPTTAQATETTPTISTSPSNSAAPAAEIAPTTSTSPAAETPPPQPKPDTVQEIGPNGTAVDITPSDPAPDAPSPDTATVPTAPNIADATQPSEVATDPAVTVTTTVNPITGQVTAEQAPVKPAEANTPGENNLLATDLIGKLTPGFKDGFVRLDQAISHESLNYLSHSGDDVYGTLDPETHKVIPIKIDSEYAKTLQAQYEVLVAILANDQTFINSVNDMFAQMPLDANKQVIIDTVEKVKFTQDGVADLEPAQKIATLTYITYITGQTQPYAQKIVDARMAEYKKAQDKKRAAEIPASPEAPSPRQIDKYTLVLPQIRDKQKLADAINAYIKEVAPDSPYVGLGMDFVEGGIKWGVNPAILVVGGNLESGECTAGVCAHHTTYNLINRDCPPSKPGKSYKDGVSGHLHRACAYLSPEDSLLRDDFTGLKAATEGTDSLFQYEHRKYLQHGITSLEQYLGIFTPTSESGDARHRKLLHDYKVGMDKLYAMAGDAIFFNTRLSTLHDLPHNPGSRYTTKEVADSAKPGDSMFGPNDPCAKLMGNVRVLCGAQKFFGIRYGTKDPAYAPKWEKIWNQKIESWGGHNPRRWILDNKKGSTNDFLECSGFVAVAYKAAYNVDVDNCSAGFLSDKKNFKQINPRKIRPGDIVIASKHCGGRQGGHVALVESYNPKTGDLVTYESSAGNSSEGWARSGRITHHKIGVDFHYAARYIGPGSDADLNS